MLGPNHAFERTGRQRRWRLPSRLCRLISKGPDFYLTEFLNGVIPMPAYFIADVHVTDHEAYDDYKRQVGPQIAKFGGRFLVRGGNPVVLEGSWRPDRVVVIEFPNKEAITAWYNSPEYAPLIVLRQSAATNHLIAVEGA
jgi:uncharacterized protein (DUF1330 family)